MPVPPTMATNCPGSAVKEICSSTLSPVPEAMYLKDTSLNSTSPLDAGSFRAWLSGLSWMSGTVSSTSTIRRAQATAREDMMNIMPNIITLMRIWAM